MLTPLGETLLTEPRATWLPLGLRKYPVHSPQPCPLNWKVWALGEGRRLPGAQSPEATVLFAGLGAEVAQPLSQAVRVTPAYCLCFPLATGPGPASRTIPLAEEGSLAPLSLALGAGGQRGLHRSPAVGAAA